MGGILGTVGKIAGAAIGGPVGTAIGIGSSLLGGSSGGSKSAAAYGNQASALQQKMYEEGRADLAPYRKSGQAALTQLGTLMGLPVDRADVQARLLQQYPDKYKSSTTASSGGQSTVGGTTKADSVRRIGDLYRGTSLNPEELKIIEMYRPDLLKPRVDPSSSRGGYLSDMTKRAKTMREFLQNFNGGMSPGGSSSASNANLQADVDAEIARLQGDASYGSLSKKFGMEDYQADPGYAFRLAEGEKALQRGQSARGNFLSGAAVKAAQDYGQGLASQEYGNAYQRFRDYQDTMYNKLSGMSNQGMGAVNTGINQGQNYADQMGTIYGNLANLKMAESTQNQNMIGQTIGGLFGGGSQYGNTGGAYGGGWGNYGSAGRIDWFK